MSLMPSMREASSRSIRLRDRKIHYHEAGTGPALLCLHGGGGGASGWMHYHRNFEGLSAHFRTILIDVPGFGRSDDPAIAKASAQDLAALIGEAMDALSIGRAFVIGWSMGATIGIKLAAHFPDRVEKLVLIGGSGFDMVVSFPVPSEGHKLARVFLNRIPPTREQTEAFIRIMIEDQATISEEVIEAWHKDAERLLPDIDFSTFDVWTDVPKIGCATLAVRGLEDRMAGADSALLLLRRLRDGRLHFFNKCGHAPHWERPEAFNNLATLFFRE